MQTVSDILKAIGRKPLAEQLGVTVNAVGMAAINNSFPASWHMKVTELAGEKGIEVPYELFNWKGRE